MIHAFWQLVVLVAVIGTVYICIHNAMESLNKSGLKFGFSFLNSSASFGIGETVIEYSPQDSYLKALVVGFINSLKVIVIGIILSTLLGVVMGVARISDNWMAKTVSGAYVEIFRNTPLLVQIFIWYFAVFLTLPKIQDASSYFGFYFTNRGFVFPWFEISESSVQWFVILAVGFLISIFVRKRLMKKQIVSGNRTYPLLCSIAFFLVFLIVPFFILSDLPLNLSVPTVEGMGFIGGYRFTPEFAAILFGLVFYTASYITEIVRGGIQSVSKGQIEAAKALGFTRFSILRLVTFPQAIRTIIPPVTSQYLNLAKNSSLAVAVAYPDLVNVGYTVLNQTGKAIEVILIFLVVYLTISLITSFLMNIYNNMTKLVER